MNLKRISSLIICLILLAASLVACTVNKEDENDGKNNVIFSPDEPVSIVVRESSVGAELLKEKLLLALGYAPAVISPEESDGKHEIHIGNSGTAISKKAYTLLDRKEKDAEDDVGYLIYSNGLSVAIAYGEDKYGIGAAELSACEYFVKTVVEDKTTLQLNSGTVYFEFLDPIEYQKAIDAQNKEEAWQAFIEEAEKLGGNGEAIAEAVNSIMKPFLQIILFHGLQIFMSLQYVFAKANVKKPYTAEAEASIILIQRVTPWVICPMPNQRTRLWRSLSPQDSLITLPICETGFPKPYRGK